MCLDHDQKRLLRSVIVGAVDSAPEELVVADAWGLARRIFGDRLTYPELITEIARVIAEGVVVPATLSKAKRDTTIGRK